MRVQKIHILFTFLFIFTFVNANAATLYKSGVTASYYAEKFHGRKTSNGEVFNMYGYTAAHKTLPFNTMLKVTNLANNKSVIVRVNDRGPFVAGREIDLSKTAAVKLDMIKSGTAKVRIEILAAGENSGSEREKASVTLLQGKYYDIQLGAFANKANARALAQKLVNSGFTDLAYQTTKSGMTRVVVRRIEASDVEDTQEALFAKGFTDQFVRLRKE